MCQVTFLKVKRRHIQMVFGRFKTTNIFLKIQDSVGLYQKLFKSVNFDRVNNNKDVFETMHICVNVNVSVNSRFIQRIIAKLLMRCVR